MLDQVSLFIFNIFFQWIPKHPRGNSNMFKQYNSTPVWHFMAESIIYSNKQGVSTLPFNILVS